MNEHYRKSPCWGLGRGREAKRDGKDSFDLDRSLQLARCSVSEMKRKRLGTGVQWVGDMPRHFRASEQDFKLLVRHTWEDELCLDLAEVLSQIRNRSPL